MKKLLIPKQYNNRQYLLYDAKKDFIMGVGDCLTLQNCFGYIDVKNYPRSERQQDGKMTTLAFDMNCRLYKRVDTDYINPKDENKTN